MPGRSDNGVKGIGVGDRDLDLLVSCMPNIAVMMLDVHDKVKPATMPMQAPQASCYRETPLVNQPSTLIGVLWEPTKV